MNSWKILILLSLFLGPLCFGELVALAPTLAKTPTPAAKTVAKAMVKKDSPLKQCLERIEKTKGLVLEIKKTVSLKLLKKEEESEGTLKAIPPDKIKLELNRPIKTELVLTKNKSWLIEFPVFEEDPIRITKLKSAQGNDGILVAQIFNSKKFFRKFKILNKEDRGGQILYHLKSIQKLAGLNKIEVEVDVDDVEIKKIKYEDELGNTTTLVIEDTDWDVDIPKETFEWNPPKNAEIQEM